MRWRGFWPAAGLVLIAIDQAVKKIVVAKRLPYFKNYQFAFSLPVPPALMYFVYALILAGMIWYVVKNYRRFSAVPAAAWTLIFAGSLSNIGERLVSGYVRDFTFILTGVFNLADFYIILGIILLLVYRSDWRNDRQNDGIQDYHRGDHGPGGRAS